MEHTLCALRPVRAMTRPMHQDVAAAAAVLRRTIMVPLLLLLMICLSSFPSVTAECPDKCMCRDEVSVNCFNKGLDRIPDRIHPATKNLDLRANKISDIEPLAHLTELKYLDLDNNKIRDVEPLAHLIELEILYLSSNEIRDIKPLAHLTELKDLYLRHNEIRDIEPLAHLTELTTLDLSSTEISDIEPLAHLTELEYLDLGYNKISDIEPLAHLRELEILDLKYNKISDIEPLAHLRKLQYLKLDHNPLTCDCNILLFINVLKKSYPEHDDVLRHYDPSCHFPVDMREKSLKEITENDFNCTSPDVIVVPENKTVSVGEQLQLSCKAVGDPEPSITWTKDDIDLELGQRVQVFQNNTLIISKVERTDGGQYKCVAFNSFGRKSFEAMVIVNDLAENGCNTMFGVIPGFFFIIIILANCLLYNDIF